MRTELQCFEPNPHKRLAILNATKGVDVEYDKYWDAIRFTWVVTGTFTYNIDRALKRLKINLSKDERWTAPEWVDDECLSSPEESDELYRSIDKALLARLFSLKRIERKLGDK